MNVLKEIQKIENHILENCPETINKLDDLKDFLIYLGFKNPVLTGRIPCIFLSLLNSKKFNDSNVFKEIDDIDVCLSEAESDVLNKITQEKLDSFSKKVLLNIKYENQVVVEIGSDPVIDLFISDLKHCTFTFNNITYSIFEKRFTRNEENISRIKDFLEKNLRINEDCIVPKYLFEQMRQIQIAESLFSLKIDQEFVEQLKKFDKKLYSTNIDIEIQKDIATFGAQIFRFLFRPIGLEECLLDKVFNIARQNEMKNIYKYIDALYYCSKYCKNSISNMAVTSEEKIRFFVNNRIFIPNINIIGLFDSGQDLETNFFYMSCINIPIDKIEFCHYINGDWRRSEVSFDVDYKIYFDLSIKGISVYFNHVKVYETKFFYKDLFCIFSGDIRKKNMGNIGYNISLWQEN